MIRAHRQTLPRAVFFPRSLSKGVRGPNPRPLLFGKRGGVVHISREATLDDILKVCKVNEPKKVEPTPPAPKVKANDETEQNLDRIFANYNGSDEEKFRQYFREFPEVYRKKIFAALDSVREMDSHKLSYCFNSDIHISLAEWGRTKATIAHESGHAVLNKLIFSEKFGRDTSEALLRMARNEIGKWAKDFLGDNWRIIARNCWDDFRMGNYIESIFEKMGVKYDLHDNLEALSRREMIVDAMGAAFGGRIMRGHEISYYNRRWSRKAHELCANITSALCDDDKIPPYREGDEGRTMLEIMNEVMPETVKWVKKNLFDVD